MNFLETCKEQTFGMIQGFDRLIFRGYIRNFFSPKGMYYYLSKMDIRLTGYKKFVDAQTKELRFHIEQLATQQNIKIHYINNSKTSKDQIAKSYLEKHPTQQGLIAILSCLEVSSTFNLRGDYLKQELVIRKELGQHLHYYLYYMDAEFGWMHVKLQSYYPFTIQVYINGRSYLQRALDQSDLCYESYMNSVTWVSDIKKAQKISDGLIQKKWDRFLNVFAQRLNPHFYQIQSILQRSPYYWCLHQSEYATDVLFKERTSLEKIYPALVQHAIQFKGGEDIYTFFGRNLHHLSNKEVTGSSKRFIQGLRVKHRLDRNSIKMYDKQSILRIETTINNSKAFKIYKDCTRNGQPTKEWRPMGKAVSNLYRYADIARSANNKYLNSLVLTPLKGGLTKQLEKISQRTTISNRNNKNRSFSALNLLSKETTIVLAAINDGRFSIQPFSNKQLRQVLIEKGVFSIDSINPLTDKQISGKTTRLLAKLRAHKLIQKIGHSFKYKLTKSGQQICNAIQNFKTLELQIL